MSDDKQCPFCTLPDERIIRLPLTSVIALRDGFPVTKGHTLVIPTRHIATWFDATPAERMELWSAIDHVCAELQDEFSPDGFNFGINSGETAGQTIPHLHLHIIPRYKGDVDDPRGGVRHVIPTKGNYLRASESNKPSNSETSAGKITDESPPYQLGLKEAAAVFTSGPDEPLLPVLTDEITKAEHLDIAVAFIFPSGLNKLRPHIDELLQRGGKFRLLTGDYLNASDPDALQALLDIQEDHPNKCKLYVYSTENRSFHPKSYLMFDSAGKGVAFVGSSNISYSALQQGVEWNYRISSDVDPDGWRKVAEEFDRLLSDKSISLLDSTWLSVYRQRRKAAQVESTATEKKEPRVEPELPVDPEEQVERATPHEIQEEALAALVKTRANGNRAGLVVLATGIGKTWLSAFDVASDRKTFKRILFVAHREEILKQSRDTFRRIDPISTMGLYNGAEKREEADFIFASIQTLSRQAHLEKFRRDEFDYIVVDEFHHAAANTYRRLIDYFTPKFMLGLTATPERTDGGDLLALCDENLVYRCDVPRGINMGMLCAYHYFGVPDTIDYKNIPWRSRKFDELALSQASETQERANNIFEQWQKRGGESTIGFCVSQTHANFMRNWFGEQGIPCASVHSGDGSDPRTKALEDLESGALKIVFAVDMFNEGVDIPALDTVMMLRPTESAIIWLQQFGRGLRKRGDKVLTVIDYIGNHKSFLLKLRSLLGIEGGGDARLREALLRVREGQLELPIGCEVTYELEVIDVLSALLRKTTSEENAMVEYYKDFRELHGERPTATETYHDGYLPNSAKPIYGSWLDMVREMGDLTEDEQNTLKAHGDFLKGLETTSMSKSYKMVLLKALLNGNAIPGEGMPLETLADAVQIIAERTQLLSSDFGSALSSSAELQASLKKNPINAWTDSKALNGPVAFEFKDSIFSYNRVVDGTHRTSFQKITREILDWRLAAYLDRTPVTDASGGFIMKVSHSNKNPILFLPDRTANPQVPTGWHKVECEGRDLFFNFVKVAVNVVAEEQGGTNVLAALLRGWFGPDAGLPGTNFQLSCQPNGDGWKVVPDLKQIDTVLVPFKRYSREQIPTFFNEVFNPGKWQAGHITSPTGDVKHIILLVTMEKSDMQEGHRYADRFLSEDEFEWQSQNSTSQTSNRGKQLKEHAEQGLEVHLFIRKTKKVGSTAAPFTYFGPVDFKDWEGEKPITIRWKLRSIASKKVLENFID